MRFKSCRKCKYNFIPPDYDHCPKCNAALTGVSPAKLFRFAFVVLFMAGIVYVGVVYLPRLSITLN